MHLVLKVVSVVPDIVVVCESWCSGTCSTDAWLLYIEMGPVYWLTVGVVFWSL